MAKANLLKLRGDVFARGARIGLVVFPVLVDLTRAYPFSRICAEISHFGREAGYPVHELLPGFLGQRDSELWVSGYDQHPNAQAHAIAAQSLLPFIVQLLGKGVQSGSSDVGDESQE